MNLTTDPWIPVVWDNGTSGVVSLVDAFSRGHDIRDLSVRPHERIALMRLLICITQAALDGPADSEDWKTCQSRIVPSVLKYLSRWQKAFELFGNGPRFLQIGGLKKLAKTTDGHEVGNAASKLDLALATGNNSTLFDNAGGSERIFTPANLALNLLSFQCFSPGGTIGVALWNGRPTPGWKSYPKPAPGQSNHAPCLPGSMLHAFPRGANLAETVRLNLLSKHVVELALGSGKWGRPIWEAMPVSPEDDPKIINATTTYLGRLAPLSRAIRLEDNSRFLLLANALTYAPYPEGRELSATVVVREQKGAPTRTTLGGSLDRAPWRELHSLTVKRIGLETNGGPLALRNLGDLGPEATFDLWVGALVTDKRKAARVLDTVEAVFHVPTAMLTDVAQRTYEQGVRFAEATEYRLRRAISTYHKELGDNLDRAEMRERRQRVQSKVTFQFWTDMEQHVIHLLAVAENPTMVGLDKSWHKTDWGQAAWRAAFAAFERVCTHETARQVRAYALGRRAFFAAAVQHEVEEKEEVQP
jgi:CRISPR system Cascade subunit CasA